MEEAIIPFGCGFVGSVFFSAAHYLVKSQTWKDWMMFLHLIWGGSVFVPTALCNLMNMPWLTCRLNFFFAGTMTPVVFSMFMRKRRHSRNEKK